MSQQEYVSSAEEALLSHVQTEPSLSLNAFPESPPMADESEWVRIKTERPELEQYNNLVGVVVARIRIAGSEQVQVRIGKYTPGFDNSELRPLNLVPKQKVLQGGERPQTFDNRQFQPKEQIVSREVDTDNQEVGSVKQGEQKENSNSATPQAIALELIGAKKLEELNEIKSKYGPDATKEGWRYLGETNKSEQERLSAIAGSQSPSSSVNHPEVVEAKSEAQQKSPPQDSPNIVEPPSVDRGEFSQVDNDNSRIDIAPDKVIEAFSLPALDAKPNSQTDYTRPPIESTTTTEEAKEKTTKNQEAVDSKSPEPPSSPEESVVVQYDPQKDNQQSNGEIQDPGTKAPTPESLTGIDLLYQKLRERSDLNVDNLKLSIFEGADVFYRGTSQETQLNLLSNEQQDLIKNTFEDPSKLQGELKITANDQTIFHVKDGELKIDQYGLAGNQKLAETQTQAHSETPSPLTFDAAVVHGRYQQDVRSELPAGQAPIDVYEAISRKALDNGLSQEQAKQVLQQDPFHQSLALGVGQQAAARYSENLLKSMVPQSSEEGRITALENRMQNLEAINRQLYSQLETVNQKLDRLSVSKAFQSKSPGLNQFLNGVRETVSNTFQGFKNTLRQKAGEVSLSIVNASAKTATKLLGEESKDGLRVIDASNGKRMGMNQQGDVQIAQVPRVQSASEYKRLSQGIEPGLPPSLQVKQVAQAALKERFTISQVQTILSESPKFKEIHAAQGPKKAEQFAGVAISAAQRQNAIDSQPKQREQQKQKQLQA